MDSTFTRLNYVLKEQSTIVLFHGSSENDEFLRPNGKVLSTELGKSQRSVCWYGANALLDAQYLPRYESTPVFQKRVDGR